MYWIPDSGRYYVGINATVKIDYLLFQFYLPWGIYMMDSLIQSLPQAIRKYIEGREYTIDDMGKSGSKVLIFKELGIEPDREKIDYYILLDELF